MNGKPEHYITLHASVLREAILDIVISAREHDWTAEQLDYAIQGVFVAAYINGGTIHSIEEFTNLVLRASGTPPNTVTH